MGGIWTHGFAADAKPTTRDLKIQGHPRLLLTVPRLKVTSSPVKVTK
jgi:hypothetical protein